MRRKRTTRSVEFTFERREFFVVANSGEIFTPCTRCGKKCAFVTPTDAARFSTLSVREIFRLMESAEIHFIEKPDRSVIVCLDSLRRVGEFSA
jgi:hypothetical protein